ncbi:MAG: Ribosomal large subunit pseudouridine synthase D [Gammaproteobacteria bacterium]|nr:Ribosomal large subunit pseudouridine synthase D [Gammaproteobacteria bacterium]
MAPSRTRVTGVVSVDSFHRLDRIPDEYAGRRVDKVLAVLFPQYSRSTLQLWLKQGRILIDDDIPSQKDKIHGGESVELSAPGTPVVEAAAEDIPLDVQFCDEHILVINKPAGLVVHPGAGNPRGTLMNALLFFDPDAYRLARAGIVHRLDKDTSGLMVIARCERVRLDLIEQLAARTMQRNYQALLHADLISGRKVDEPIGRHPRNRRIMAVRSDGKQAATHVRVLRRFGPVTLVRCTLESGRTHQIRVHMSFIGFPVVGDPLYGGAGRVPPDVSTALRDRIRNFGRQVLHAESLSLRHPSTREILTFSVGPPDDFAALHQALVREFSRGNH